jgi:hypothetical protein
VETEALSSRELLTRLENEYRVCIGPTTLRMKLKRLGYVWKRTRYSLKKTGRRSDSNKLAPQPPNRSTWSRVGKTHAVVSKRSQRLNVIGALLSSGRLVMAKPWRSVNGLRFFGQSI